MTRRYKRMCARIFLWLIGTAPYVEAENVTLFSICIDGRRGFIDREGEVVISPRFLEALEFSEGLAAVRIEGTDGRDAEGFINTKGEFVIGPGPPANYKWPDTTVGMPSYSYGSFADGRARFWVGDITGRGGYIDKTGKLVIDVKFRFMHDFSEGLASVEVQGRRCIIDLHGNVVLRLPNEYGARGFVEGRSVVEFVDADDRWRRGFIDRKGNQIVPPEYGGANDFSEGLAVVWRAIDNSRYRHGFVGLDGRIRLPLEFDFAESFGDGRAFAVKDGRAILIDRQGQTLRELNFDPSEYRISQFREGLASIYRFDERNPFDEQDAASGVVDVDGKIVVPLIYDLVESFRDGLALVRKGDLTAYIDRKGNVVWSTTKWGY